jgi:lysozyme family protein
MSRDVFEEAWARSGPKEGLGAWSNDALDRGGETYTGIARKARPDWHGWSIIDALPGPKGAPRFLEALRQKRDELLELVKADYRRHYWDRLGLGDLPRLVALELFDTALNQGSGAAVRHLQRCLNALNMNGTLYADVVVDGDMGPATRAAVVAYFAARGAEGERVLWKYLNCLQGAKYIELAEKDQTQERFVYGWAKRIFEEEKC